MHYHFKIHQEKTGFRAHCLELEGCATQADNLKELSANMKESINLYLENPSHVTPLPDHSIKLSDSIVEVMADPNLSFALLESHNKVSQKKN